MGNSPIENNSKFCTRNQLISWYVGGLNFQIEHHLFPKISHIHYPAISKIIKQACQEHGVVYVEFRHMHHAVASHVHFLGKWESVAVIIKSIEKGW